MINNTLKYIPHLPRSRTGSESIHDPHEGYLSSESIHFTNPLFDRVCDIFLKPKEERTDSDIEVVVEALKTLKFFQDAQREDANFDEFLTSVYNSLNFEHFHKNQAIFHQGERGSKFYIILKGRVDVYIPKSREEIEKEIKEKKLNHLKDGLAIPKDLFASDYAESNRTSFIKISEDSSELLRKRSEPFNVHLFQEQQHLGRRGSKKHKSSFHKLPPVEKEVSVFSSFPERQESYIENGVVKFKLVRTLISGNTFGEVALSSDMPRSATVIASRDLQVLTLSKAAYKKISENLEKGLKLKWKFFAEITDNSSKEAVLGFCYGFKERTYKYGQTLFFQGQIPKEIFLIREGEVQIVKYESQEENLEVHKHFKKKKKNFNEKRIVNLGSFNLLGGGFDSLDQRYEHTARCVSNDTVVYVLPIQDFENIKDKYGNLWKKVFKKHEAKVKFYKNRILNINQVHEKIEEQQQSLIKNLENKKFYLKEGFDNNSISNLPNSNSDMSSRFENDEDLIISRNSLRKRTLKISTQNHFGETIQDSNQALTRSSFSSEKNLSFRQDEIDTEKPFDRKFNALSSIKKESSLIPEIVKNIRKPTQTTSFKKRYSTKISSQANNIKKKKSILPAFPSKGDYHENDSSKTTIKGFTLPLLDIKKINSNQELEGKVSPFISARSKGNCLTLDDSPRSKKITFLKYLEDNVKNPSLLHTDQSLQRISIQNKFENLSSKGFLSARDLHPLETSSPYFNSEGYIVTDSNANMAHLELNSPFASKKNKLSLCINTFKTSDMISSTSRVFRKNEEIVSPDSNIKEIFKVPMSVRGPSNKNPLNSKTIFPSKHNMFRMKPDKLHIFNNYYKNNSYKK